MSNSSISSQIAAMHSQTTSTPDVMPGYVRHYIDIPTHHTGHIMLYTECGAIKAQEPVPADWFSGSLESLLEVARFAGWTVTPAVDHPSAKGA